MIGFKVCGTHKNWECFTASNKPKCTYVEEPKYVPKDVLSPVVKKASISELSSIIGR
jgi:hypothetical protein